MNKFDPIYGGKNLCCPPLKDCEKPLSKIVCNNIAPCCNKNDCCCPICEKGDKGDKGDRGETGCKGEKGDRGERGEKGDRGEQGVKGDTGATGPKGDPGVQGIRGDTGLTGPQGIQGVKGDQGLQGVKGDTGAQGIQGIQGVKGDKGDTGLQGLQGVQGVKGDTGATGAKGDPGLQGAKGDKGATGLQGLQGVQGVKGDTGATGAKGDKGDTGARGDTGATGPQGPTGATGPQGPTGPKGDPGCSCGVPGPAGPQGPAGATGAQGPEGKSGGSICPCEITFGKVVNFLLENKFLFDATIDVPFDLTLSSTLENPAELYNTWEVEFENETLVPLCKLEAIYLSFTTEQERAKFVSLLKVVLNQTLCCFHNCSSCEVCSDELLVDEYKSIIDMPSVCDYEYYLKSECNCTDSECLTIAKQIDLCSFTNTSGEKLRQSILRKAADGKIIEQISTQKAELLPTDLPKTIESTGLSSALLSYDEDGEFKIALVCLERVTAVSFADMA